MSKFSFLVFALIINSIGLSIGQRENAKCDLDGGETFWKMECKKSCGALGSAIGKCNEGLSCCYDPNPPCELAGARNSKFICKEKCDGEYTASLLGTCGEDHECCTIIKANDIWVNFPGAF